MTRVKLGTMVLVALTAFAPVACGGKTTVNADDAAKQVVKLVADQNKFTPTDVKCPSDVEAAKGGQFDCHFTGPRNVPYVAHNKIVKVDGERVTLDTKVEKAP
ncbi:hypothetical protein BOO86_02375 [Mycobacterium sp. CBMA 234]|uniref:DUF4333 domain-containing protein n=1 Tax=Mycolicibacterium sp. CBMA 234 TaxID=1918495 RepID=UPI001EE49E43|nr:DUF4333 domain-containing protein [Mycolicibacterium sp. CBMA 234]MUL63299.1 hypothetical protein [Mycolicibacterium sp. CBMA 234]